jgi:hypothetical protein
MKSPADAGAFSSAAGGGRKQKTRRFAGFFQIATAKPTQ